MAALVETSENMAVTSGFKNPDGSDVLPGYHIIFNPQFEWTGGGFASTTSDLAKWAKFYFEGRFFSAEMLTKIVTPTTFGSNLGGEDKCGAGSFIYETKINEKELVDVIKRISPSELQDQGFFIS